MTHVFVPNGGSMNSPKDDSYNRVSNSGLLCLEVNALPGVH